MPNKANLLWWNIKDVSSISLDQSDVRTQSKSIHNWSSKAMLVLRTNIGKTNQSKPNMMWPKLILVELVQRTNFKEPTKANKSNTIMLQTNHFHHMILNPLQLLWHPRQVYSVSKLLPLPSTYAIIHSLSLFCLRHQVKPDRLLPLDSSLHSSWGIKPRNQWHIVQRGKY